MTCATGDADDYSINLFEDNQLDRVLDANDNSTPTLTGDEQDSSSVMSELDLQNAQPPSAGWLGQEEVIPSQANINNSRSNQTNRTLVNVAPNSCGEGGGEGSSLFASSISSDTTFDESCERTMAASSMASVSDYSDDGSLRSIAPRGHLPSPSTYSRAVSDGASGAVCTDADVNSSYLRPALLRPRPSVQSTPTTLSNLARVSPAHARSTVTSGLGAPILPATFVPNFYAGGAARCAGDGNSSANSAVSTRPALGGFYATTVLPTASDAAMQALMTGRKRFRDEEAVSKSGEGVRRQSEVEGISAGGMGAVSPAVRRRAKREERLMKNREAANRSRIKVPAFPLFVSQFR